MLSVPNELRQYLDLDGPPLPLIDADAGQGYMLMPVAFTRDPRGRILARVPGIRAVGEANQATEALATLAFAIKDRLDEL